MGGNKGEPREGGWVLKRGIRGGEGEPVQQSHKKQKLSGKQDFCSKNFPDKARQFSNSRQMRIKGGFARFYA